MQLSPEARFVRKTLLTEMEKVRLFIVTCHEDDVYDRNDLVALLCANMAKALAPQPQAALRSSDRNAVVEECAKVAEQKAMWGVDKQGLRNRIVQAIRSLKDTEQ